jgi:ankyrin repeat protein
MLAAHAGRLDLVRLLLEKGADANVAIKKREVSTGRNSSGGTDTTVKVIEWTALKAATENGNASIVELLRQAGATR